MPSDGGFAFGKFLIDPQSTRLLKDGVPVPLTAREFVIFLELVKHAGQTISHDRLIALVWGDDSATNNSLVQLIFRLREKLAKHGLNDCIEAVSRDGYRFILPVEKRSLAPEDRRTVTPPSER